MITYPEEAKAALEYPEIAWRYCTLCHECWPAHSVYFPMAGKRGAGKLARWCRACWQERRRINDAKRRTSAGSRGR